MAASLRWNLYGWSSAKTIEEMKSVKVTKRRLSRKHFAFNLLLWGKSLLRLQCPS